GTEHSLRRNRRPGQRPGAVHNRVAPSFSLPACGGGSGRGIRAHDYRHPYPPPRPSPTSGEQTGQPRRVGGCAARLSIAQLSSRAAARSSRMPDLEPLGDQSVLAAFADEAGALRFAAAVRRMDAPWVVDVVQAYATVAVFFDADRI